MAAPMSVTAAVCRENNDSDDEDEWLFSSIKRYKQLHMFELQASTRAIEWIGGERVCVACLQPDGTTEILQLNLPDKLLVENEKNEGLASGRDFHFVSGGFHDKHVYQILCVPNKKIIVCSELGCNKVTVWNIEGGEGDLFESVLELDSPQPDEYVSSMCISPESNNAVVFGSTLSSICVADIEAGNDLFNTHALEECERLSSLYALDSHTILAGCQTSADIWRIDIREKATLANKFVPGEVFPDSSSWVFAISNSQYETTSQSGAGDNGCHYLARLSSEGALRVYDVRSLSRAVCGANLGLKYQSSEKQEEPSRLCIQFSPLDSNILSVSGADGKVYIYDRQKWPQHPVRQAVLPLFTHQGHQVCSDHPKETFSLTHLWHPRKANLILSTATDGSLHAWSR